MNDLGARLQQERKALGATLDQLAAWSGVSAAEIAAIEAGSRPAAAVFEALCLGLGVSQGEFYSGEWSRPSGGSRKNQLRSKEYSISDFEKLWPESTARSLVAGYLRESIFAAHEVAPSSWSLSVHPNGVRLNVGQVAVLEVGCLRLSIYVLDEGAVSTEVRGLERRDWRKYKAIKRPTARFFVPLNGLRTLWPHFSGPHLDLVRLAAGSKKGSPFRDAHSSAFVDWISKFNEEGLPQPSYVPGDPGSQTAFPLVFSPNGFLPEIGGQKVSLSPVATQILHRYVAEGLLDEVLAIEGARRSVVRTETSRSASLRDRKIAAVQASSSDGRLRCEVEGCGFDFEATYGELGKGFAHVHHLNPLGESSLVRETRLSDLAIVCANCHAMIHRGGMNRNLRELVQTRQPEEARDLPANQTNFNCGSSRTSGGKVPR